MSQSKTPSTTSHKDISPERLLRNKLSNLSEGLDNQGTLSEKEIVQLKTLSDLVTLRTKYRPWWQRRKIYWLLALFLLYGLGAWMLLRPHEAVTIQLEATVSGVTFKVNNVAELATSGMRLSSLGFNRATIVLPTTGAFSNLPTRARENLNLEKSDEAEGNISFNNVNLVAGSEVVLQGIAGKTGFRLEVFPTSTQTLEPFRANVVGTVLASGRTLEIGNVPSGIEVIPTDSTSVDFTLATLPYELLDFKVPLESLSFKEVRTREGLEQPYVDLVSTLKQGSLYIESLNKTYDLRSGQNLTFDTITDGFITSLQLLENNQLKLQFRGTVSHLKTGYPDNPIDLMPTSWAWLQSRELALLALSTLWTLFTFALPYFISRT
jgi:hypothetical protein